MAYTALYRELRPKVFSDVIGQDHITTTLKNELINNRIAHAYLFSGTRGTGKTTCAKIFSKALNCLNLKEGEPCNECENCKRIDSGLSLDVLEQDAATNNKVDDIRDLIDEVQYPPQEGKYKVYILDEAHMLTIGAVNAFLKTLEEPPNNTVFILATTDPQKLPVTILSRCQRFEFKRISAGEIEKSLRRIVDERGIFADNKALELIARVCEGAMRDALSILDQIISMSEGRVEYEEVIKMLGLLGRDRIFDLGESILNKDVEDSLRLLDQLTDSGKDPYFIAKDLLDHFRNVLMTKIIANNPEEVVEATSEDIERYKNQALMAREQEIIKIIRQLQQAEEDSKKRSQGRIYLELALIKMCNPELDYGIDALRSQVEGLEKAITSGKVALLNQGNTRVTVKEAPISRAEVKESKKIEKEVEIQGNPDSKITLDDVKNAWASVHEALKAKRQMVVKASLTDAIIKKVDKGIVTIEFPEKFSHNKTRLEKPQYWQILNETMSMILGERVSVKFTVDKEESLAPDIEDILRSKGVSDVDIIE